MVTGIFDSRRKNSFGKRTGSYHLIVLDLEERKVVIHTYGQGVLNEASDEYAKVEKEISKGKQIQAVPVSA